MKRWAVEIDEPRISYYDESLITGNSAIPVNLILKGILDFTYTDSLLAIL